MIIVIIINYLDIKNTHGVLFLNGCEHPWLQEKVIAEKSKIGPIIIHCAMSAQSLYRSLDLL
jgi:hypothetical protein